MAQKRKQVGGRSEKHLNFITVKSLRWNLSENTCACYLGTDRALNRPDLGEVGVAGVAHVTEF